MSRTASWSRTIPQFLQKLQRLNARGAAFRIDHRSWWKEELPKPGGVPGSTKESGTYRLGGGLHHHALRTPPAIQNELLQALSRPDELTDFLEEVQRRCRFPISLLRTLPRRSGDPAKICPAVRADPAAEIRQKVPHFKGKRGDGDPTSPRFPLKPRRQTIPDIQNRKRMI